MTPVSQSVSHTSGAEAAGKVVVATQQVDETKRLPGERRTTSTESHVERCQHFLKLEVLEIKFCSSELGQQRRCHQVTREAPRAGTFCQLTGGKGEEKSN